MPLRDRNGDPVAAMRPGMKYISRPNRSKPRSPEPSRAVREMESHVASLQDLVQ